MVKPGCKVQIIRSLSNLGVPCGYEYVGRIGILGQTYRINENGIKSFFVSFPDLPSNIAHRKDGKPVSWLVPETHFVSHTYFDLEVIW